MSQPARLSPFGNALAGAIGGCLSNAVVYPLDTVKTRIQADTSADEKSTPSGSSLSRPAAPKHIDLSSVTASKKDGVRKTFMKIWKEQGIEAFYRGFGASMLNTFSMQFAYFYFYALVRATYLKRLATGSLSSGKKQSPQALSTATELILGAIAGVLSSIFTIPVSVIATEDGITGLWRGLRPSLVLTINPAITYGVFERIRSMVQRPDEAKMGSGKAFLVGAGSKALATIVTYPYIMAKVRLQAKYDEEESDDQKSYASVVKDGPTAGDITQGNGTSSFIIVDEEKKLAESQSALEKGQPAPASIRRKKKERYNGAIDVLVQTLRSEGITGWYRGMQAQITKATLAQALLFGIKDYLDGYTLLFLLAVQKAMPGGADVFEQRKLG
ncbi:mitochondrial carrier [Atractiella rhizophila]|nr:mitochondrial carrier [Atractiella rhizophila]